MVSYCLVTFGMFRLALFAEGGLREGPATLDRHSCFYSSGPLFAVRATMKNAFTWLVWLRIITAGTAQSETCSKSAEEENESLWFWIFLFATFHIVVLCAVFAVGRRSKKHRVLELKDVATQKNEPIVHERLRELNRKLQAELDDAENHRNQSLRAAREARAAMALQEEDMDALRALCNTAKDIFRALEVEMDDHAARCPYTQEIYASKKGGCWHRETCHIKRQIVENNMLVMRPCPYCAGVAAPPDRMLYPAGWCIRMDIHQWYRDHDLYSSPSGSVR